MNKAGEKRVSFLYYKCRIYVTRFHLNLQQIYFKFRTNCNIIKCHYTYSVSMSKCHMRSAKSFETFTKTWGLVHDKPQWHL